ncbi:uncharacterized protein [Drosophila pseudoobscura]|uniref:Uncharacterized protein n=1 Tax=Drosophila pseudoobscura pseudoobscura TaxID=46245 RepID=A0A6I8WEW8_DROPS|nr:uncharacterized protein LOC117185678 [Drosophila pseudoobscura]
MNEHWWDKVNARIKTALSLAPGRPLYISMTTHTDTHWHRQLWAYRQRDSEAWPCHQTLPQLDSASMPPLKQRYHFTDFISSTLSAPGGRPRDEVFPVAALQTRPNAEYAEAKEEDLEMQLIRSSLNSAPAVVFGGLGQVQARTSRGQV